MIPKVEACLDSLRAGVRKTHMIDGRLRAFPAAGDLHRPRRRHGDHLEIARSARARTQQETLAGHCGLIGISTMNQATLEQFQRYVIANYTRYPVCLVRGEGSSVWDDEGNRYLDFFPGWGCDLLGHCPPRVVKAVQRAGRAADPRAQHLVHRAAGASGQALSERTGWGGQCFFCNSGTEANEAAIKLARLNGKPGPLQDHQHAQQLPRPDPGQR